MQNLYNGRVWFFLYMAIANTKVGFERMHFLLKRSECKRFRVCFIGSISRLTTHSEIQAQCTFYWHRPCSILVGLFDLSLCAMKVAATKLSRKFHWHNLQSSLQNRHITIVRTATNMQATPSNTNTDSSVHTAPIAVMDVTPRTSSMYPTAELQAMVTGRAKRALGPLFGLTNFGMNHTTLAPGGSSSITHYHTKQEEMIYILSGTATLRLDDTEVTMNPGDVMGFPAGRPVGHSIVNRSTTEDLVYLEIGDRTGNDTVFYHHSVDLEARESNGKWGFYHKDGTPY
jgi:uncharacterized cupin superfamily protein